MAQIDGLQTSARWLSLIAAALALLVLLGWIFNVQVLLSPNPAWPPMVPNTAIGLLLCATAVGLLTYGPQTRLVARALGVALIAGSGLLLWEFATGSDLGLRYWIFRDELLQHSVDRVALGTALCFLLIGILLLIHDRRRLSTTSEILLQAVGLLALARFLGYPFGVADFQSLGGFKTMAISTSACFVLLWLGLMFARGRRGALGVLLDQHLGGRLARWVTPAVLLGPLFLGWLRLQGQRLGYFDTAEGTTLYAISMAVIFSAIVLCAGRMLNQADAYREAQEARLRRSEARLKRLFDSPLLGVFTWSREGWVTDANDQFLSLLGFTREDVKSGWMSWSKEMPDRRGTPVVTGTGVLEAYETELTRADGSRLPVMLGAAYPDAELDEGIGFILDNSDRKQALEQIEERNAELEQLNDELERSEHNLRTLFESPLLGISFWRMDGTMQEANAKFLEMLGYSQADLATGRLNWESLSVPGDADRLRALKQKEFAETGRIAPYEREYIRQDGSHIPVLVGAAVLDAQTQSGVSFILDMTEQQRSREMVEERNAELEQVNAELAQSEERLRRVVESPLIGITFWRLENSLPVLTDANERFLEMLGYTREDLAAGRLIWEKVTTPEEDQQLRERNNREFAATGRISPYEREYVRADGTRLPVLVGAVLIDAATNSGVSFVLDMTEQRHQRELIEERNAELEQLSDELARSESRLRVVFESSLIGMFFWRIGGQITGSNARFNALTGYSAEEVAGGSATVGRLTGPENEAWTLARRQEVLEQGRFDPSEVEITRTDGSRLPIVMTCVLLDKERQEGVGLILDISEQFRQRELIEERNAELEQVSAELARNATRLRAVFDSSLVGMFYWQIDGTITEANSRFSDLTGYSVADIASGHVSYDLLAGQANDAATQARRRAVVEKGELTPTEVLITRADGSRLPIVIASMLLDREKRQGVSLFLDASEQYAARELIEERNAELEQLYDELASSENRLRRVFDSPLMGMVLWRMDGTILSANRRFFDMVGYVPSDIGTGRLSWQTILPPEPEEVRDQRRRELLASGEIVPVEREFIRSDGTRFPVMFGSALFDTMAQEGVTYILDISEQRRQRELIEERNAELEQLYAEVQRNAGRMRAIFESSLSAMAFSRSDGTVTEANSRFIELTGVTPETIATGQVTWLDLTPPELRERSLQHGRRMETQSVIVPEEDVLYRADGSRLPVLAGGALLPGPEREWVAFLLDISEQARQRETIEERNAELEQVNAELATRTTEVEELAADLQARNVLLEQLREAAQQANVQLSLANADLAANNERLRDLEQEARSAATQLESRAGELQRINAELDSFSYSVSHDLRAPLRAIEGFSKALEEDYADKLDADAQRYIGRIRAGTLRMAQLIDDLLQLSRVSRAELTIGKVDLSELARVVAGLLSEGAGERQVTWDIEPGLTALGDGRLLRIVLENLLGNAFKFTSKRNPAHIGFNLQQTDAGPAFCVSDNGAGFDMTFRSKLFTAFQRLHSVEDFPGTGIGLSIVRRIISRHEGEIWAESAPDSGARFFFTLAGQEEAIV